MIELDRPELRVQMHQACLWKEEEEEEAIIA